MKLLCQRMQTTWGGAFLFLALCLLSVVSLHAQSSSPTLATTAATSLTTTTATLNGTVNPNGLASTITFEYGLTNSYGNSVPVALGTLVGSSTLTVSGAISGLTTETTYHFRIKGINSGGTSFGSDGTFTTASTRRLPNQLLQSLSAPYIGNQVTTEFGASVAANDLYTAIGVPKDDVGFTDSGVVKIFNTTTGTLLHTIPNPGPGTSDLFGNSIAISGSKLVVGCTGDDLGATDAGGAYVYDLAGATPTVPLFTLINPAPAMTDNFGNAVAISGNLIVIGARLDDLAGTNSGTVYVYDITTITPTQPAITIANPDPLADDEFGNSVGISGMRVIVGTHKDDAGATDSGRAYVFDLTGGVPTTPVFALDNPAPATTDLFGCSVTISGTYAAVGAKQDDGAGTDAGAVYVYNLGGGTPTTPIHTLTKPSSTGGEFFGTSVALSGTRLLVGAMYEGTGAVGAGSAYVYNLSSGTPTVASHILNNPAPAGSDEFGTAVAVFETTMLVGTPQDDATGSNVGSAYLYSLTSGTPTVPTFTLHSPGAATDDRFGSSISVSETHTVVGSPKADVGASNAGAVYVYDSTSGTPTTPVLTINNPSPTADDNFGAAVSIHGSRIAIGAPFDDAGAANSGSVYLYDLASGTPTVPTMVLTNPLPANGDNFGNSVAFYGTILVVGASEDDTVGTNAGAVYVYDLSTGAPTSPTFTFNNPSPDGDDSFGSTVAISGRRVVVAAVSDPNATNVGSVYVYNLDSGTATIPAAVLANPAPNDSDSFGYHVAISGSRVVVGALGEDASLNTDVGIAYVYDMTSGTPTVPVYTLNNPTPANADNFGHSVAISGDWVAVAASNDGTAAIGSGSVYFYDLGGTDPTIPLQTLTNPSPNANDDFGIMMAMDGRRFAVAAPFDDTVAVDKGMAYLYGPSSEAEISVELLSGGDLTDGSSTINFGYGAIGTSMQRTFVIKNLGSATLTGLSLSVDGLFAGDFGFSSLANTPLTAGSSRTFTVTFTPSAAASLSATLHVSSNDPDESPFDITLLGAGQIGSVDLSYDPQIVGGLVYDSIETANGKIIIGGDFHSVGGQSQANLARLNSDGSIDPTFAPAVNGYVSALAIQSDGKILIGGWFTLTESGQSRSTFARLNADGTLDTSMPNLNLNSSVEELALQSDGKIVLGGFFSSILAQTRTNIARINSDGSLDAAYAPNTNGSVDSMAVQADGKLIIGGQFTTLGGTVTRNRIARINEDGTLDSGFDPNVNSQVRSIAVQADGKIVFGGLFTTVSTITRNRIARLNANGTLDTTFNPNANSIVHDLAVQADGKIVVVGNFTSVAASTVSRLGLARLLSDGGIDMSFNPGCDGSVRTTTILADGRILIGGRFAQVGGQARNLVAILGADGSPALGAASDVRGGSIYALSVQADGKVLVGGSQIAAYSKTQLGLSRLLQNGQLDSTFTSSQFLDNYTYTTTPQADGKLVFHRGNNAARANANGSSDSSFTSLGANNPIYAEAMQADGKILIGGNFTTFGAQTRNNMARIDANGTLDAGFTPNLNNTVLSIAVQPDGKILIGGNFTIVGGVARNRIARLNADGTLDTTFDPNAGSTVDTLLVQPDGKILIGGFFTSVGGYTRNRIARLNTNGTLDGFNPNANNGIYALALQANGQVLAAGEFTTMSGHTRNRIARINADGSLDPTYTADINSSVYTMTLTADGQVLVGGEFSFVNSTPRNGFVRLANTPAMQSLTANSGGAAISWVRTGTSPEVDRVTFESSLDGVTWTSQGSGARTTAGWQLTGLALPTTQSYQLRARGFQMTGGQYGGDSSIYETTAAIPVSGAPEIVVEQPSGSSLTDGISEAAFGSANLGATADLTFVIRNTGTAPLTNIAANITGLHASDFTLLNAPDSTLNASSSTAITVRFTGGEAGMRYGHLRIYSNDSDEAPFDVSLTAESISSPGADYDVTAKRITVASLALLNDGKLLIGGNFTTVGSTDYYSLARFNQDHTVDITFPISPVGSSVSLLLKRPDGRVWMGANTTGSILLLLNADGTSSGITIPQPNSGLTAIALQADGKTLIGGAFTTVGGVTRNRLARLNADFTLDATFDPNVDGTVNAFAVQSDGKILIGGNFTTVGGVSRNRLARLNEDGSLDATFDPNVNSTVNVIMLLPDGTIIIGGSFTLVTAQTRNRLARLNADGTLDAAFNPNVSSTISAMVRQTDGKIIISGFFTTIGGTTRNRIARLNTDGTLDSGYDPNADAQIVAMTLRTDGRLYVGGSFMNIGGQAKWGTALLNADGTVDTGVNLDSNGAHIYAQQVQADGKVILSGIFTDISGQPRTNLARLLANGSLDPNYAPFINSWVYSAALQTDGRLIIGGNFTSAGGSSRNYIARLYSDGTLDPGFNPNANGSVECMAVQTDGKIVIGGFFTTIGGVTRNRIARLNADGTLDLSFDPNLSSNATAIQITGGQILVSGNFTTVGGTPRNRFARLNTDGSVDMSFNADLSSNASSIRLQSDGKIIIGGQFITVSGATRNRLARLNSDGTLDPSFNPNANGNVNTLGPQADGKILVGGQFTKIGEADCNRLARLHADGTLDLTFTGGANSTVRALTGLPDGGWLVGGSFSTLNGAPKQGVALISPGASAQNLSITDDGFGSGTSTITWNRVGAATQIDRVTFESSQDGETWTLLNIGSRTATGWQLAGQTLPTAQSYYLRAQGRLLAGATNGGHNSTYESVIQIHPSVSGESQIVVEQPAGTALSSGTHLIDFGSINLSTTIELTYVIRNTGTAPLTGIGATVDGPHGSDFSLTSIPALTLAAGDSTTFIVRFAPSAAGVRHGLVHVYSNDTDHSPFNVALTGTGQFAASSTSVANVVGGFVSAFARRSDGKLWVGGNFDQIGGAARTDLARLNADGTLDTTLNLGNFTGTVEALLIQADGKLLFGGSFSSPFGSSLRRLNANGTHDTTFAPLASGTVEALAQQSDGKLIVVGSFTSFGGQTRNRIVRLNLDGTLDTSFNPDANSSINAVLIQADGKIVVGGFFTTIGGVTRNYIARLNPDGTLDTGFDPNANSSVYALVPQPNGKFIATGAFTTMGGITRNRLAQFNADGSLRTAFDANPNGTVNALIPQADGKFVIGGTFSLISGQTRNMLARLNADGTFDASYNPDLNSTVSALTLNPDGSAMAGGFFTMVAGLTRNRLARIQSDGTLDTSLDLNCNGAVIYATVQQADGKTLIGGWFTHVNNVPRNHIARLNVDGSLDSNFNPNSGGEIYTIACQPDGSILIGGLFSSMGGTTRNRIARVYPNGTLDTAFNPNASDYIYTLVLEPSGTILIGGQFTSIGGTARNRLARLHADGTLNTGFDPNLNGTVFSLAIDPTGKIVAGGSFSSVGGTSRSYVARINSNGSLDTSFSANLNGTVNGTIVEPDNRILVHGFFTTVGGTSQPYLARLNTDGTLAGTFSAIPNADVRAVSRQVNGSMVVGGNFTSITKAGIAQPRNRLALLTSDGRVATDFDPNANFTILSLAGTDRGQVLVGGLHSLLGSMPTTKLVRLAPGTGTQALAMNMTGTTATWVRSGTSPEVDRVTFESSADGNTWTSLGSGTRTGTGWQLLGLSLSTSSSYYLRARGYQMTGSFYGGDSSVYEAVERIRPSGVGGPEIAVEQPMGTNLVTGTGQINFGTVSVGSSADLTFTVKNTGSAPLTGLAITFAGGQQADYSVTTTPADSVSALNGTTTFTVKFTPGSGGARTAALSLWNNDADENPFTISLTGNGSATLPAANTLPATVIHSTAAILNGSVSDNGASTTVTFDYGLTTTYGLSVAAQPSPLSGGTSSSVSVLLPNLTPSTTYHFRVRAVSSAGPTLGANMSFTTPASMLGEVNVLFNQQVLGSVVRAIAVMPDGKVLFGGTFTSLGGTTRTNLARLNADGTLDTTFSPNVNGTVTCIVVQADGSYLVGGSFTFIDGISRNRIARFSSNGSLDLSFDPNASATVLSIVPLPNGQIVLGGSFTTVAGVTRNRLARINADGSLDSTFDPNASGFVTTIMRQANGGMIIGGQFTSVGGQPRNYIARINSDGSVDPAFTPDADNTINSLVQQTDGKILVGGNHTTMSGASSLRLTRLNADGSVDTGFLGSVMNNSVNSVLLQADGKILVGGWFTTVNGIARNRIVRLNADGSLDTAFSANPNNNVEGIALQADGRVLVGGTFTAINGLPINYLGRLENTPSTHSLSASSVNRVQWLRSGTSPEAHSTAFEVSTDGGATYTALGNGTRISGGWELTGLNLPFSGSIRARAQTAGGYYNSSNGIVQAIQSFSGLPVQEISVFDGASTSLANSRTDNIGSVTFTETAVGSSSAAQTFTIQNVGGGNLTGLSISSTGGSGFTFTQPAVSTLTPGAFATFTVTFSPTALGAHTATLQIASNDFDENPFDISLSGNGTGSLQNNYANRLNLGSSSSVNITGSNVGATIEAGENTLGNIMAATMWAQWTAPSSGWVTIHTAGSKIDTVVALYTGSGSLGSLDLMGFNDESPNASDLNYYGESFGRSRLVFHADAGTTYTLAIGSRNDGGSFEPGAFELHVAAAATPPIRVSSLQFVPSSLIVTSGAQTTSLQLSIDSDADLFPNGYLSIGMKRPGVIGTTYDSVIAYTAADRAYGSPTSGNYQKTITIPRYVPGGNWPATVMTGTGNASYQWSLPGNDLDEDFYLIPDPSSAPLTVTNTGSVDTEAPVLVTVTGFPASVDVTTADATFNVDITVTDNLAGLSSASIFAADDYGSHSINSPAPGSFTSGTPLNGVYRQSITIPQGTASGTYYPELWLRDAAFNQSTYTDRTSSNSSMVRITPAGTDLKFQVIGGEPEIEVLAPNSTALTDGVGTVYLGAADTSVTKANYDFSGSLTGEFTEVKNTGIGTVTQNAGVLKYHTSSASGEAEAAFSHKTFRPAYNQSWSAETNVTIPSSIDATLSSGSAFIDNGLVVTYAKSNGRTFRFHASLSVEPQRKFMAYCTVMETGGAEREIAHSYNISTASASGIVRVRFDATTKTLTAETGTHTLLSLNLATAGFAMANSDTFAVGPEFAVSGCAIPSGTPITQDDFRAAFTYPTAVQTFTVSNTGPVPLHNLQLAKDGAHAADFSLGNLGTFSLLPGSSTTFTATFAPSSAGLRTAAVHITSTDANENPFDITLTGNGGSGAPVALTLPATNLTRTGASLNGLVNDNGHTTTVSFEYGLTTSYGWTVTAAPSPLNQATDTVVTKLLTGLTPGTTFHYRVRAVSSQGTTLGADSVFTTPTTVAGTVDTAFNQGYTTDARALAIQADGKTLVGSATGLFRIHANGTLDSAFTPQINGAVTRLAVQPDRKILLSGPFTTVAGAARNGFARLNADGTLDATFTPALAGPASALLLQPDGKVLIGGGTPASRIARMNADGSLDTSFTATANGSVNSMAQLPDGKIIVVGTFSLINGEARSLIARLNSNGTFDSTFIKANLSVTELRYVAVQGDGKIIIGGGVGTLEGQSFIGAGRLNSSGTADLSFGGLGLVDGIVLQADGGIISYGNHVRTYSANGAPEGVFLGAADVAALAIDGTGRIIVAGNFTTIGGISRKATARLTNNATTQSLTVSPSGIIRWSRGGTSSEAQWVTFETSINNGVTWVPAGSGVRVSGGWELTGATLPTAGVLRAIASTMSSPRSSGILETTATFTIPSPEIAVFNGNSTAVTDERTDNTGVFAFGPQLLNTSASRTFTIKNVGTATLSGLGVTRSGTGEFLFTAPSGATLAPGAVATFTVTFFPSSTGLQTATLNINSDDADENPFEVQVSGHGQVPPEITLHPTSRFIALGGTDVLRVTGTGTALEYQWLHNGLPVPGATTATLSISNSGLGHAGVWSARVFNGVGSQTSLIANIGVIDQRPSAKTTKAGETLTLLVAGASPGGTYRWFKNGVAVSRGINPETKLVLVGVRLDEAGAYTCEMTMPNPSNPLTPLVIQSGAITVAVGSATGTAGTAAKQTQRPVMLPFNPGPWIVGGPVNESLAALHQPTRFKVTGLPAGVTLDPTTGRITGTPTVALVSSKSYPLTITASNVAGTCLTSLQTEVLLQPLPGYTTGTFTGLISRHDPLNESLGGTLTLTVTTTASYTGHIKLGNTTHSFSGKIQDAALAQDITIHSNIRRPNKPALDLNFTLRRLTGELVGTINESPTVETTASGWRSRGTGASYEGIRLLELAEPASTIPTEDSGVLQLTTKTSGAITWVGVLPDGTKFTGSTALTLPADMAVWSSLYSLCGSIQGWLSASPATGANHLGWLRNPSAKNSGFPLRSLQVK